MHLPHLGAVLIHRFASLGRRQFCGRAVLIRGAEKHDLMTPCAQVTGIEICGKLTSDKIAQMLDAVDIRDR